MAVATGVIVGVIAILIASEIRAWAPLVIGALIRVSVRRLPSHLRARYDEEWRADLIDTPGIIAKVAFALGLLCASSRIRAMHRASLKVTNGEYAPNDEVTIPERLIAAFLLFVTGPLFVLIVFAMWLSGNKETIFEREYRLRGKGEHASEYFILRFRTKHKNMIKWRMNESKGANYPFTPIGRALRETDLDQLPNLVNVVRGEMSLNLTSIRMWKETLLSFFK